MEKQLMAPKTTRDAMVAIAERMQAAIKAGRFQNEYGADIMIDLGDGDFAHIFNDAGSADYTQSMSIGGVDLEYGDDFG